jgi:hypothetical protein
MKLKTELRMTLALPLLGVHLKECKFTYNRDNHVYSSTIHNRQTIESVYVLINL